MKKKSPITWIVIELKKTYLFFFVCLFCFCLGFHTNLDKKPRTFYIEKDLNSTELVHSCISSFLY